MPQNTGHAFRLGAGRILRISLPEGPQVVDLNVFNAENPQERFAASTTRTVVGAHAAIGSELLSVPPFERPLMRVVADSLAGATAETPPAGTGEVHGTHDLLFPSCTRNVRRRVYGTASPGCYENLTAALAPCGLDALVHDPLNLFMTTGIDADGRLYFRPSVARRGDFVELQAEVDCVVALSTCPGACNGPVGHPILVEAHD